MCVPKRIQKIKFEASKNIDSTLQKAYVFPFKTDKNFN